MVKPLEVPSASALFHRLEKHFQIAIVLYGITAARPANGFWLQGFDGFHGWSKRESALAWTTKALDADVGQPLHAEAFVSVVMASLLAKHWLLSDQLPQVSYLSCALAHCSVFVVSFLQEPA